MYYLLNVDTYHVPSNFVQERLRDLVHCFDEGCFGRRFDDEMKSFEILFCNSIVSRSAVVPLATYRCSIGYDWL